MLFSLFIVNQAQYKPTLLLECQLADTSMLDAPGNLTIGFIPSIAPIGIISKREYTTNLMFYANSEIGRIIGYRYF